MSDSFDPYYEWLGIPADEQPPSHYRLLGISQLETNPTVIENATDRQMQFLRTFQNGPRGPISQRLLNEVARARYTLLDQQLRVEYDRSLAASVEESATPLPAALSTAGIDTVVGGPASPATPPESTVAAVVRPHTGPRHPAGRGRILPWMISSVSMTIVVGVWYQFVYVPKQKEKERVTLSDRTRSDTSPDRGTRRDGTQRIVQPRQPSGGGGSRRPGPDRGASAGGGCTQAASCVLLMPKSH